MNKTLNSESISIEIPIQTIMNAIHSFSQDNQLNQLQLVILTKEQYDESQNSEKKCTDEYVRTSRRNAER